MGDGKRTKNAIAGQMAIDDGSDCAARTELEQFAEPSVVYWMQHSNAMC